MSDRVREGERTKYDAASQNYRGNCLWFPPFWVWFPWAFLWTSTQITFPWWPQVYNTQHILYECIWVHFYILVPNSTQVNTSSILPLDAFLLNLYIKRSGNFFFSDTFITYKSKPSESESEVTQSCPTLCDPMDGNLPGSSVYGIFQARILEWAAISFSRRSSQPRDRTQASCTADRGFTIWATREALVYHTIW